MVLHALNAARIRPTVFATLGSRATHSQAARTLTSVQTRSTPAIALLHAPIRQVHLLANATADFSEVEPNAQTSTSVGP
jgi:hypothetical protein